MQSQTVYLDLVGVGQKSTDTLNTAQSPPKKFYLDLVGVGQKESTDTLNTAQSLPEGFYLDLVGVGQKKESIHLALHSNNQKTSIIQRMNTDMPLSAVTVTPP